MSTVLPGGAVHDLPADLCAELTAHDAARTAGHDITPLARDEFIR